jgi:hypothetical protein
MTPRPGKVVKIVAVELHWHVLDKKRRALLPHLAFWKKEGLYLAGGTALALHLGHRTSLDFDYYSPTPFNPLALGNKLKLGNRLRITTQKPDTLLALAQGVQVSAFHYPYRLLAPLVDTPPIALASLEDIAAMKMLAITQRGTRRDFIDLYFLCRRFTFSKIMNLTKKKYPSFEPYSGLRAAVFFDDAEKEKPRLGMTLRTPVSWSAVKRFFSNVVRDYV